jgi:hypothetical protein
MDENYQMIVNEEIRIDPYIVRQISPRAEVFQRVESNGNNILFLASVIPWLAIASRSQHKFVRNSDRIMVIKISSALALGCISYQAH